MYFPFQYLRNMFGNWCYFYQGSSSVMPWPLFFLEMLQCAIYFLHIISFNDKTYFSKIHFWLWQEATLITLLLL